MRALSRREFMAGAAGTAAVAALPLSTARAAAAAFPSHIARPPASEAPLSGATVNLAAYRSSTYIDAANTFDGYVGESMATSMQKIFMGYTQLPAKNVPAQMSQLATAGCHFAISVEPSMTLSSSQQTALANFLALLNKKGLNYRVILYSECNDTAFNQADWLAYWSYYAPVVQDAGVQCGYNPGCNPATMSRAEGYFPSKPTPDEMWMDFYATSFRSGGRVEPVLEVASKAGVPCGIAEWGWSAGRVIFTPMVIPWWNLYCNYLIDLVDKGDLPLGAIFFGAVAKGGSAGVIKSAKDPRIPGIQSVSKAILAS
jgi:hypothetical protein